MHKIIMNTHTIYDYHTVSNTRGNCLVNKANTTTLFQTNLFPLTVDTQEIFLQKPLNDPITHSEELGALSDNLSSGKHRKVKLSDNSSRCLIIHRSRVLESLMSF